MAKSKAEPARRGRTGAARSPEIQEASRELAALALARLTQDDRLNVRQREQLRRALATIGEAMEWSAATAGKADPVAAVTRDVMKMAKKGTASMAKELEKELSAKRTEVSRLDDVADSARTLAEDPATTYPLDITFVCTARNGGQNLVTKTETRTVNDPGEAVKAAESLEQSLESRGKLADQMIDELKAKRKLLGKLKESLPDFVGSSHGLIGEVLDTLQ